MDLLNDAKRFETHLIDLRRWFHRHPEVSLQEIETSKKILEELLDIGGYEIRSNFGGYGILAEIKGKEAGKTICLRADMDALSVTEDTGLPFSSENDGVMHACGHDHHITMLLGAARLLKLHQEDLKGTVRLIFQPAEEYSPRGGARSMIEEGALQDAAAVFGLHVWPNLPAGKVGVKAGPQMAASDRFTIEFLGETSHGAMPDQGNDALIAGCQFVNAVQTVVSRNMDPMLSGVITIGTFQAGSRYNVVPGSCRLEGTVRSFDKNIRETAEKRIKEIFEGIKIAFSIDGELTYEHGYNAVMNDPEMADYVLCKAEELFGKEDTIRLDKPAMTAEDFAFYLEKTPGAFYWLGTTDEGDKVWPLHSAHYKGNEAVLCRGAALMAKLALDFG